MGEYITQSQAVELINEIAVRVNGEVRDDYSGRFMFGDRCYGVVAAYSDAVIAVANELGLTGERVDNMGRSVIVYWPQVTGGNGPDILLADPDEEDWDEDEEERDERYRPYSPFFSR